MSHRRTLLVGNWKMCASRQPIGELKAIGEAGVAAGVEIVICPPAAMLNPARRAGRHLRIGAQDCHHLDEGPYTGEVSPKLLREAGASHVILGHSDRRLHRGETDADVCAKAAAAIRAKLIPIICVGENAAQREAGATRRVIASQLYACIPAFARGEEIVVAYEPVWAFGSGVSPSQDEIGEVHSIMRSVLREALGFLHADDVRLIYGGPIRPTNAGWIIATPDVDGLLVGTASLSALEFIPIIDAAVARRQPSRKRARAAQGRRAAEVIRSPRFNAAGGTLSMPRTFGQ